jgi:hypothetical protein
MQYNSLVKVASCQLLVDIHSQSPPETHLSDLGITTALNPLSVAPYHQPYSSRTQLEPTKNSAQKDSWDWFAEGYGPLETPRRN